MYPDPRPPCRMSESPEMMVSPTPNVYIFRRPGLIPFSLTPGILRLSNLTESASVKNHLQII